MNLLTLKKSSDYFKRWFAPGAMAFSKTKIESELINDEYFITSDRVDLGTGAPRFYNIRQVVDGSIKTIGDYGEYLTLESIKAKLLTLTNGDR